MTKERVSVSDLSPDDMELCLTEIINIALEWRRIDPSGANGWVQQIYQILEDNGLVIESNMVVIDSFRGEHGFLSNFYPAAVSYEGRLYPTTEHAFQAAKSLDPKEREDIRRAGTAGRAKHMGKEVNLRKDWESVKYGIMLDVVRKKFQHPELRERLLATGNTKLIEGNT
jgi:predicted NAD-dependent protein-ADP-ribosyltransferase YbiA (DUF1768 family)